MLGLDREFMTKNQEFYGQFLDWLKIGHSPATVSSYRWGLKIFIDWLDGTEKEILELKQKDFTDYALYLKDTRQVKGGTQASYFCSARTMWRWLYKQGRVKFNDDCIPVPKADDQEHYPFLTEEELNLILNSFDEFYPKDLRDKTIFAFMFATGVRLGELLSIDAGHIDLEVRKAVVKTEKRRGHEREVYWDERTNELLKKWLEVRSKILGRHNIITGALFINMSSFAFGRRAERCVIQRLFRRKRKELGISKKITPHSCRHGFGHKAVKMEVHPRILQKMLGHAKLNTTMLYMGVADAEVERVYREKMTVLDNIF